MSRLLISCPEPSPYADVTPTLRRMSSLRAATPDRVTDHPRAILLAGWITLGYVLVATNLVMLPRLTTWYDQQRILQVILLASITVILLASRSVRAAWLDAFTSIPRVGRAMLAGFFLLGMVSVGGAALPRPALREFSLFLLTAVLAVAIAGVRRRVGPRFDRDALTILLVAAILYTLIFLGLRVAGFGPFQYRLRTYGAMYGFSNPRMFGQYVVWTFPLLVAAVTALDDGRRVTRSLILITAACWWALTIEAGGRASIGAGPLTLVLVTIVAGRASRVWTKTAAIAIAGGTALWFGAIQLERLLTGTGGVGLSTSAQRALERGATDAVYRPVFWGEAWQMLVSRPFFGVGPEHFAFHRVESGAAAPHNVPLQLAAEWGVPAAILLIAAVGWGVVAWVRRTRQLGPAGTDAALRTGLFAAATGAGLISLVDGVIVTPIGQVLLAIVAGWMIGMYTPAGRGRPETVGSGEGRTWRNLAIAPIALVATATLIWTASPYLYQPRDGLDQRIRSVLDEGERILLPRFWVEGRLPEPRHEKSTSIDLLRAPDGDR